MSQDNQSRRGRVESIAKELRVRILGSEIRQRERYGTIEALAAEYNTSRTTIQRALDELEDLVEIKARKGIWLRPQPRQIIGVVIPGSIVDNEFMSQIVLGAIKAAHERKCHLTFEYTEEKIELEAEVVNRAAEIASALVVIPTGYRINSGVFANLMKQGKLVLFADRPNTAGSPEDFIHFDDVAGGRLATDILLAKNASPCKVVYFLGDGRGLDHLRERAFGWSEVLQEYWDTNNIQRVVANEMAELKKEIPEVLPSGRDIRIQTKKYCEQFMKHIVQHERKVRNINSETSDDEILSEVGVVAAYEFIGLGIYDYLYENFAHHKKFSVRLCSYDGMSEAQALRITSVRQDPYLMGYTAVTKAYDHVWKGERTPTAAFSPDIWQGITHLPNWLDAIWTEQRNSVNASSL